MLCQVGSNHPIFQGFNRIGANSFNGLIFCHIGLMFNVHCSMFCQIAFNIRIVQINMFSFSLFWQMGSKYCSRKYYLVASTELAAAILFAPCMNIANYLANMAIENNTHYMHQMKQILQVIWQIWQTICRIYYKYCTFHGKQFTLYAPYDAFTVHIANYMA